MTNPAVHYTAEQFNLLLDGRMSGREREEVRNHLSLCKSCQSAFDDLSRIDVALRGLPVPETRADFTRSVMNLIAARRPSPVVFRILEKVPYIIGLLIVLGIMVASFEVTGVFDRSQLDRTKTVASGVADKAGEALAASISGFTAWLVQYLPFAFGKGSMGVAFFVAAVVVMLAALDRWVGRKILQKGD